MQKQTGFKTHMMFLAAMMVLGQSISVFPIKLDKNAIFHYIFSFLFGLCFLIITSFATKKLFTLNKNTPLKKAVCVIVYLRIAVYAFVTFWDCLFDFGKIVSGVLFFGEKVVGILLFCAVIVFFSMKSSENILKFSLLSAVFSLIAIAFFVIFLSPNYNFENISIKQIPNIKTAFYGIAPLLRRSFLPIGLLYFYEHFSKLSCRKSVFIKGYIIGGIALSVALFCPVLIFGNEFIKELTLFPFDFAVTTLSFGRLFSRLDGVMYIVYFLSALLKCVVCVFVFIKSLSEAANILNIKKLSAKTGENSFLTN